LGKVAFIVEPGFLSNHFGVRNYFSTIKEALAENGHITEYLVHGNLPNVTLWYKVNIDNIIPKTKDLYLEYDKQSKLPYINFHQLDNFTKQNNKNAMKEKKYLRFVGESLKEEKYDIAIITNPWTIDNQFEINANRIVGIVYDFIASIYSLTKPNMDLSLGNFHHRGYSYYNKYCDDIMAISSIIAEQYTEFYPHINKNKINYFKPFVPYGLSKARFTKEKKENAMILAAPFDLRKGLKKMPELINGVKEQLDTLYIFGMPRCQIEEFNQFFNNIDVKHIVYYPYISNEGLVELYKKCKLLLFPSVDEGLGFPIIEAQICGCRVATTNKKPMNTLGLQGSYLLSNKLECNIAEIKDILQDQDFSYSELSDCAREKFLYQDITEFVTRTGRFSNKNKPIKVD